MADEVSLRKVGLAEMPDLREICIKTYSNYFYDYWMGPGLELYLEEQFGMEKLNAELTGKTIDYFYIIHENKVVGFMKVNYSATLEGAPQQPACELEKMYLLPEHKEQGMGSSALKVLIESLRKQGARYLFLCVLDTNQKAIAFYKKSGFEIYGQSRLKYIHFKEHLKGLFLMRLELNQVVGPAH